MRLKGFTVLLWGSDGSGKTPIALELAKQAGPAYLFDTDGGALPYITDEMAKHVTVHLDRVEDDPIMLREDLGKLLGAPGKYRMAIIDSLSVTHARVKALVEEYEHQNSKRRGRGSSDFESSLSIRSWGPIKQKIEDISRLIRSAGMPVICTAREGNVWKNERIIDSRPDGDAKLGHEFSLSIRLSQPVPGGTRFATLRRDRLQRFPYRMEYASDDVLAPAWKILELYPDFLGGQAVPLERATKEQVNEMLFFRDEMFRGNYEGFMGRIRQKYQVGSVEDLSPEQAGEILATLREARQTSQENASQSANDQTQQQTKE